MIGLIRYLTGYVLIMLSGEYSERLLSVASSFGIRIWKLCWSKNGISGYVTPSGFKKLRTVKRGENVKIKIIKKGGFPFFIVKYKKRIGFITGAVIFFVILKIMSGYIWSVNVEGCVKVKPDEIIKNCAEMGIVQGVKKTKINPSRDAQRLLLANDDLAWASLNIEGSVLTVNVTEIKNDTNKINQNPCNIKANADGIIEKFDITHGTATVKVGDAVKKGDIIVSGVVENLNSTVFVHSSGAVYAKTSRTFKTYMDYKIKKTNKNGNVIKRRIISLFGLKIPLFAGKVKKSNVSSLKIENAKLFGNTLPICIYERKYEITEKQTVVYNEERLKSILKNDIAEKIKECGISEYEIINESFTVGDKGIELNTEISATENIAVEDEIFINVN